MKTNETPGSHFGLYEELASCWPKELPLRPGGFDLTERALSACAFAPGSRILDVGCGSGATVEYLVGRHGFDAFGVDVSWSMLKTGLARSNTLPVVRAEGENLPFRTSCLDGVLAECSLSVVRDAGAVLREFRRVLRTAGKLVVSDLYLKDPERRAPLSFAEIPAGSAIVDELESLGFHVLTCEDHSSALAHFLAQAILSGCSRLPCCTERASGLGYFLLTAVKSGPMEHIRE